MAIIKKIKKTQSVKTEFEKEGIKLAKATAPRKSALLVDIFNLEGVSSGTIDLPKEIFSLSSSDNLLAQYVRVYLANQRQGTQSTKTRSEVIGTTAKIYKQKGTGRARHGAKKAPIFVGGGLTHAPKPRDYRLKIGKKQRSKALFNALTLKKKNEQIVIIEGFSTLSAKTREVINVLKKINIDLDKKNLLVYFKDQSEILSTAARNIDNLTSTDVRNLNAYVLLANQKIIFSKEAMDYLISSKSKNNTK